MTKTKNYDQFILLNHNRDLIEAHVKKLMESLKSVNLLDLRPILVTEKMEVIDGQHRLEACKRLGLEVHYQIKKDYDPSDLINLNIAQSWNYDDYVNHFAKLGYQDYVDMVEVRDRFKIPMSVVLLIAGMGQTARAKFRNGTFSFSPKKEHIIKVMQDHNEVVETIKTLLPPQRRSFLHHRCFLAVLFQVLSKEEIDVDLFKRKLFANVDKIRHASRAIDYLTMLEDIYNYRVPQTNRVAFAEL